MSQPGNPRVLQCISPVDGTVYVERELADSNSISQSIELSRLAQKQWQQTSLVEWARICESAVAYFESKQTQIAEEIAWQMGRPVAFAGVALELGGKDPAYVVEDANFDDAVENLVDGAFFNSGQSCCGIERIYVHKTLFDTFVEA